MRFPLPFAAIRLALAAAAAVMTTPGLAVQVCDLDGQHVNPANGATTQGKSGLMRCREGESGPVVREQELQNGRFVGIVRYYRNGVLEREHRVNEKGNRDGLAREWNIGDSGAPGTLVREETLRNGSTVGLARSWYPTGPLRRASFHADDGAEQAYAEFTREGQLAQLRCAPRPLLAPAFDDRAACGHGGRSSTVVLYGGKGQATGRVVYERGERQSFETLWENGAVRERVEKTTDGSIERRFAADGVLRHEARWAALPGERAGRVKTLEQEYHESGKLVLERRWRDGTLVSEARWYLNGQPKERIEHVEGQRREQRFHDDGSKAFEGAWLAGDPRRRGVDLPTGTHRHFDVGGRVRAELVHDERGRLTREREFDANGQLVRDDEVFEDGSRKAVGR
ncbi:toxin-antitoxin system YwqK family antitoxin [Piscinibacter koreensis]|uniref:Antitoxin component YwqK of YwqJK toxin-antitoxin module n=1 Tax=Piscinibacter koreensis TaxID=2742824 RepID=A0A7Y6NK43_9BURK|nr:hypothetical protein [Schlegelella koreensis]NUZ04675.1 hypothetical protein [Schlegelella koreensis]